MIIRLLLELAPKIYLLSFNNIFPSIETISDLAMDLCDAREN